MRRVFWLLLLAACCPISGCATTRDWLSSLNEDSDRVLQHEDKWVEQAGLEARGDRPRDASHEPEWLRQLTTSDQARGIERNLGYD
jgi:hypothetical protein